MADKGYDAAWFEGELKANGVRQVVIPSRARSKKPRTIDKELYKQRNKVERYFNKLKNWRKVATRYEKTARNFIAITQFAATIINFKLTLNTT